MSLYCRIPDSHEALRGEVCPATEVSICLPPDKLIKLGWFLMDVANEMEEKGDVLHNDWHKHFDHESIAVGFPGEIKRCQSQRKS